MTALFLATWCQGLLGVSDAGNEIELGPDPLLDEVRAAAQASLENPAAFLDFEPVFDAAIRENEKFVAQFVAAVTSIRENGLRATIREAVA